MGSSIIRAMYMIALTTYDVLNTNRWALQAVALSVFAVVTFPLPANSHVLSTVNCEIQSYATPIIRMAPPSTNQLLYTLYQAIIVHVDCTHVSTSIRLLQSDLSAYGSMDPS